MDTFKSKDKRFGQRDGNFRKPNGNFRGPRDGNFRGPRDGNFKRSRDDNFKGSRDDSFRGPRDNNFKESKDDNFRKPKDFNSKNKMDSKQLAKLKKSRIIARNLPFGLDEEQLSKEFVKFGEIYEVSIPKRDDGKQKGFAFINFKQTASAIKAVKEMNGKQLSSNKFTRTIAVDFAMSQNRYINHMHSLKKIDILNEEEAEKGKEVDDVQNNKPADNDEESTSSDDSSNESDNEAENDEAENNEVEQEGSDDEQQSEQEEPKEDDKKNLKRKNKFLDDEEQQDKKPKKESKDIEEGKTLFIRNLSFESNQEDLTELFKEFGELEYCIICMDKVTEHSKGTAFVKFKNKEDADKCFEKACNKEENEEAFYLDGRVLDVQQAISKNQLNVKKLEGEKLKDKRNLYLSKEGLIYPDSVGAEGVSAEDLKKRLTLSQNKKKQLENLHYFVSKNRICFHNLPPKYKDEDLRKLCLSMLKGEKDVQILFCKIMKNKDKTTNQFTTSKGFGFVSFSTHKHALRVLRALNNNPETFTKERRPIVEFTVENLNALKKNKQFVVKESLDLGLESEIVDHKWAGFQTKPLGTDDKVINPISNKRMKDKKKKLQEKIKSQKVERREEKYNKERKESIKLKRKRIEENKLMNKKLKKKRVEQDPSQSNEQKFLSKINNSKEETTNQSKVKSRSIKKKKQRWFN